MDHLNASRVLMGDSLAFHIIFVLFGLTLPILVVWFEWWGRRTNDKKTQDTAFLWAKIMALLVITGVISGTVIALQMSLVWPGILKFGGEVIGLPFMFETYAFLIEAVFLALYLATWHDKRVPRPLHTLFGVMVIIGSTMSAFAITSVNAWMNLPTGFRIVEGKFADVDVWQAMFSRTSLIEFFHSMPAYYLAGAMFMVSIYGVKVLVSRGRSAAAAGRKFDLLIMQRLIIFSAVSMVAIVITADLTGKYLAKYEPIKFAAIEMVNKTDNNLPFVFGGVPGNDGSIKGPYFMIPNALSLLAGNSTGAQLKGIEEFPANLRPPSYVRALFNVKLTLIGALVLGFVYYGVIRIWRRQWLTKKLVLLPLIIVGTLGIFIVELGWMITEIGRQPWAVNGYVTTEQAVTKTHDITSFGYIFPLAFVLLFIVTILAARKIVIAHQHGGNT